MEHFIIGHIKKASIIKIKDRLLPTSLLMVVLFIMFTSTPSLLDINSKGAILNYFVLKNEEILFMLLYLSIFILSVREIIFYVIQIVHLVFYKTHKIYRNLSLFGEITDVLEIIDKEITADRVIEYNHRLFIMPTFTICAYKNCFEYTKDLWANNYKDWYKLYDSHYLQLDFITTKHNYKLLDSRRNSPKLIELTLLEITKKYPWAANQYTEEDHKNFAIFKQKELDKLI